LAGSAARAKEQDATVTRKIQQGQERIALRIFESNFSNFVEDTEFDIGEAKGFVLEDSPITRKR
jgi:hypothetical protein